MGTDDTSKRGEQPGATAKKAKRDAKYQLQKLCAAPEGASVQIVAQAATMGELEKRAVAEKLTGPFQIVRVRAEYDGGIEQREPEYKLRRK